MNKRIINGEIFLILSIVCGCFNDVFSKYLGCSASSGEIVFFRFLIGAIILMPFMSKNDYLQTIRGRQALLNFVRSILGVFSMWLCTYSVIHLKLIEVTILLWSIPLFELVFSRLFLRERVNFRQISATIICFICIVVFSVKVSDFSVEHSYLYILPLTAAMLFAFQDVIIKKIGRTSQCDLSMLFSFSIYATIFSSFSFWSGWGKLTFSIKTIALFIVLGICGQLMQYFLFMAFRRSMLSQLAPIRYLEFIIQAFFGFLFFSEIPSKTNIICAIMLLAIIHIVSKINK